MNRRSFLAALGLGAAGVTAAALLDPQRVYSFLGTPRLAPLSRLDVGRLDALLKSRYIAGQIEPLALYGNPIFAMLKSEPLIVLPSRVGLCG